MILVVVGYNKHIRFRKHTIVVREFCRSEGNKYKTLERVPISKVKALVILGRSKTISVNVLHELVRRGIPVVLSYRGLSIFTVPAEGAHYEVRMKQYMLDDEKKLPVAREIVRGKIMGQRQFLYDLNRSRELDEVREAIVELKRMAIETYKVKDLDAVRNIEAEAAKVYWDAMKNFWGVYGFDKRRKRFEDPRDPVNSSLNFLYTILASYGAAAIAATSLDPYVGFLHMESARRAGLVFDIIEEFRPIVDRAVNHALRITKGRFDYKVLVEAFERRIFATYAYRSRRMSAVQIMISQAREIERYLLTGKPYQGFVVR